MQPTHSIAHIEDDPSKSAEEQLIETLRTFGLGQDQELPMKAFGDDGKDRRVDLRELLQLLPRQLGNEPNPALVDVLEPFYYAHDPKRRRLGIYLPADKVISILIDRLELHEQLTRQLARVCTGRKCPHFSVCPFADTMATVTESDGILCSVERDHIRSWVDDFVYPEIGKPRVDPRKPEEGSLFKQLMHYVVQQLRYSMHMQKKDIVMKEKEGLRDQEGAEHPVEMNDVEYPLMAGWQKATDNIQKTMQRMGLTPEFQIRQGIAGQDELEVDAEERAKELAEEYLIDSYEAMLEQYDESSDNYQMIAQALEGARDLAEANAE